MRVQERAMARKQLDKRLNVLQNTDILARPPRGWIKAIRESLGMTTAQLARRLGLSQPRVLAIEKAEVSGNLKLATLERAAHALDCRLVYALVPRIPLESTVEDRARQMAEKRLRAASHSMVLEGQRVEADDEREHLEKLITQLINQPGSRLWDDQ
jgi:predicted DNA-binding mobile mystery protein A